MKDKGEKEEIARRIALDFSPLGVREVQMEPLGSGNINDSFLLSPSGQGPQAVLQRINKEVFKQPWEVIENARTLFDHLSPKSLPLQLLRPLPNRNGAWFSIDPAGEYWRAYSYLPNAQTFDYAATPKLAFEAAQAVGAFLAGLADLDPNRMHTVIPRFHDGLWRFQQFSEALASDPVQRAGAVQEEIAFVLQEKAVFQEVADARFPLRVVHNDTKIANILFREKTESVLAVIDWDTAMPGAILSDFGDMVRTMATTLSEDDDRYPQVALRLEYFEALVRGFVPPLKGTLLPLELRNLVLGAKWIILEQMIRFLADYLNGDTYYKIRFPDHNLVRTRNQMALYSSLRAQEHLLQALVASATGD